MAHVNATTVIIVGGYNSKKSYLYNLSSKQWTNGPDLSKQRAMLACGKTGPILFRKIPRSVIIAAGGKSNSVTRFKSTEVLFVFGNISTEVQFRSNLIQHT